jgi:hypothetical protein
MIEDFKPPLGGLGVNRQGHDNGFQAPTGGFGGSGKDRKSGNGKLGSGNKPTRNEDMSIITHI